MVSYKFKLEYMNYSLKTELTKGIKFKKLFRYHTKQLIN